MSLNLARRTRGPGEVEARCWCGRSQAERSMRPMSVAVLRLNLLSRSRIRNRIGRRPIRERPGKLPGLLGCPTLLHRGLRPVVGSVDQ
jgi:hypothetical protein